MSVPPLVLSISQKRIMVLLYGLIVSEKEVCHENTSPERLGGTDLPFQRDTGTGRSDAFRRREGRLDQSQVLESQDLPDLFEQALKNVLAIVGAGGGKPYHIRRMTACCCDKPAYPAARLRIGRVWRDLMDAHFPAMSVVFVSDLLDHPGKIELAATAVLPDR